MSVHFSETLEHKKNLKTKISETEHEPNEMFLAQFKKKTTKALGYLIFKDRADSFNWWVYIF